MEGVCGSCEAAQQLSHRLETAGRALQSENELLQRRLQRLETTCRDADMARLRELADTARRQSRQCIERMALVRQLLNAYGAFLNDLYVNCGAVTPLPDGAEGYTRSGTGQSWHTTNTGAEYDSPDELAKTLDTDQSKNGLGGSCGLCSCENVLRMAGIAATEMGVYQLARSLNCCSAEGGTQTQGIAAILTAAGCPAHCEAMTTPAAVAARVMDGRGVILVVDAYALYDIPSTEIGPHAITVTSVRVDRQGRIEGFIVCDSNADARGQTGAQFYPAQKLWDCLTGHDMIVTDHSIR